MNSHIANLLSKMNKTKGVENVERQSRKVGHEPTPQKKVRKKYNRPRKDPRRSIEERKSKKRDKIAYQSRRINRLRGVG